MGSPIAACGRTQTRNLRHRSLLRVFRPPPPAETPCLVCLGVVLFVCAAKNLILAGPRSVTVFDPTPTSLTDLQANYYLTPAHAARCVVNHPAV